MYFKKPCDKLYHFETKYGINQTVCEEHDVLYWKNEKTHDSCKIKEIKEKHYPELKVSFDKTGEGITLYKSKPPVLEKDTRYALITTDI